MNKNDEPMTKEKLLKQQSEYQKMRDAQKEFESGPRDEESCRQYFRKMREYATPNT